MDLRVGTAGYAYSDWTGHFYPPGTPADARLGYYATQFPVVEINSSFYGPPTPDQAVRMARRVPAGFAFTLKVPRSASHGRDARELPAFRDAANALARDGKLLGLVVQFAESFRNEPGSRDWLLRIRDALPSFWLAVEFRHASWDVPSVPGWADARGVTVVSVAVPDVPTLYPTGPRIHGERFYARLHSRNADAWYAGGAARYDHDFRASALEEWAAGLRAAARRGVREAVVIFNNTVGARAAPNARRLTTALKGAPGIRVIAPPEPFREPTLFDGVV
jgi:uncharacterized protein YecE (DUF72 family)